MINKKLAALLTVSAMVSSVIPVSVSAAEYTGVTGEHCTVTYPESFNAGDNVTITVAAEGGYEFAKLNVNGTTVKPTVTEDRSAAEYTITNAPDEIKIDAWADPVEGRLEMTALAEKPDFDTITSYNIFPAAWNDGDLTTFADFGNYPSMVIFDAGEGYKYALSKVITYARISYNGRAHFKIFGTNEPLTSELFTTGDGANSGKLAEIKNTGGSAFYGTGTWSGNNTHEAESVRGEYTVSEDAGYRYIVLQSDNQRTLSLAELKFYGERREADVPDATPEPTPEPDSGVVTINTQQNCTVTVPDFHVGDDVTITIMPESGYEAAKLNIDGRTVKLIPDEDGTASYTISDAPAAVTVDAWADPAEGKLTMTALTEKPDIDTIASFGTLPAAWSDNDTTGRFDFKSYGGMAIFDAEAGDGKAGDRYKIDRIIAYAGQDMPGRAHFKIFGTNEELSADMFTAADGANSGSEKLTALTHDNNDAFFGTGSYDNNRGGGIDAVRGEYEVNGDTSYRYIIVHSDHKNMMALAELKFYGEIRDAEHPDPTPEPTPEPEKGESITVNTQDNCTVTVPDSHYIGGTVEITVTANEGYEPAKVNVNGRTLKLTQNGDGTATAKATNAESVLTVDAWADPAADKIAFNMLTAENLPGVNALGTLPANWSDGDVTTSADFKGYPGLAVIDAGEGKRYALSKVISYARQDMNGRAHFKIFATNVDPLTADMFTDAAGANGGLVFTELTHDGDAFFGTGSYDNNRGGGIDAVRGEYNIDTDRSYRYIIIQSDHKNMMSLGELKLYGTVRKDGDPNEPAPEQGTATVGTHSHCAVEPVAEFKEGDAVKISVTAQEGYEFAKLNLNGRTVKATVSEDKKTAEYTLPYAPKNLTIDAWADAVEGRLEMTALTDKPADLTTIASYGTVPAEWSDNDATSVGEIAKYPGMVIFDAGEGSKYALSRVITYANAYYPGRAHFKLFGTNETLTADMFTANDGANSGNEKLTVLVNDEGEFYGTGSYTGDGGGNGDAVRQYYDVQGGKGYRYIILQSDNTNSLSLAELKFYGEIRDKNAPDPADPSEVTSDKLFTYDMPSEVERSRSYIVKARPAGAGDDAWQTVDVYRVNLMSKNNRWAGMAFFDCTGETEVQVTCTGKGDGIDDIENGLNDTTAIYPASYGIELDYEEGGNVITFTMKPGQRIVLDPNDDSRRDLHIWADYPIDIPTEDELKAEGKTVTVVDGGELQDNYDTDVVYVKPGYYFKSDGWHNYYIHDNQTWYFEPGAVVCGTLVMDYSTNGKIIGHGLTYRPWAAAITINDAKNAYVEGMMGLNHGWRDNGGYFVNVANSKNVYVKNLKSAARHKWGDTMDIFSSEDVTVEGCFYRGNDDCIAIYGPRWTGSYWGETGNVRNVKVRNCVLMPDVARPIHFGTHGDSASPNGGRVIDNCSFEDIDILTYSKYAPGPQGILMDCDEGNMITNIYFNDIRIQDGQANKLCKFFISNQGRYGTNTFNGRGINNIYFKDIQYTNKNDFNAEIGGANDSQAQLTQNITFENLIINGEVAKTLEDAHIVFPNRYARNVNVVQSGESVYRYNPGIVPEDIWPTYYDYATVEGTDVKAIADNGTDASAAIDGDAGTTWDSGISEESSVYDYDAKTVTGEGLTIDLGTQRLINAVRLTWADPSLIHDYRIYVSKDGIDWSVAHTDEHSVGAVNSKARWEFNKRVKTTWFTNQYDPKGGSDWIIGQYVKIIPQEGSKMDIASLEILGELAPDADPNNR